MSFSVAVFVCITCEIKVFNLALQRQVTVVNHSLLSTHYQCIMQQCVCSVVFKMFMVLICFILHFDIYIYQVFIFVYFYFLGIFIGSPEFVIAFDYHI